MNEQKLIDIINGIIEADVEAECPALRPKDIARRAIERCGKGVLEPEAVNDLVAQILSARCEPWRWPPGARPRLREVRDGVARLAPKPSAAEILEAGRQAREPIEVTLARARRAYPRLSEAALEAEVEAYQAWLRKCGEQMRREASRLEGEAVRRELEKPGQ